MENEPGAFFFADLRFKYAFVFNFEGDYMIPKQPGNQYGDISSLIGSPGQNSPTPSEKIFDSHFIVKAGGQFYDPSYGKGPFLSARDLELVEMYGYARNFGDLPVPGYGPLGPWRATKVDELTRISFTLVAAFSSF